MMIPLLFMCAVYSLQSTAYSLQSTVCSLQSSFSSKLIPIDTFVSFSTKLGLYFNNFHLPSHIHLYRLHCVKLCGNLWITKQKMCASVYGPFQVNIVEFGFAKWETTSNALFNVVDFGLKFCGTVANIDWVSVRDFNSRVTYPHWLVTALEYLSK